MQEWLITKIFMKHFKKSLAGTLKKESLLSLKSILACPLSWLHHGRDLWRHCVQRLPVTVHERIVQLLALLHELLVGLGHIQLRHGVWKRSKGGFGGAEGRSTQQPRDSVPCSLLPRQGCRPCCLCRVREDESRAGDSLPSNSTGSTCVWRLSGVNATALRNSIHGWLNPRRWRNGRSRRLTTVTCGLMIEAGKRP